MTHLIASIPVETTASLKESAGRAWNDGATAIELRIDTFDGDPQELSDFLAAHRDRTWIVTGVRARFAFCDRARSAYLCLQELRGQPHHR